MAEGASGFWSYVHDDDDAVGGRISALAEEISKAYGLLTGGQALDLFLDHANIEWGEDWELKIREALERTVFFIPIVTPRYFKSAECRRELLAFAGEADSLGLIELLLPIYYVDVEDLEKDSEDKAVALVAKTQYEDWRELRLETPDSPNYQKAVEGLAKRLVDIASRTETKTPPSSDEDQDEEDEEGDGAARPQPDGGGGPDGPGSLELLATMEDKMPLIVQAMEELAEDLQELTALAAESSEDMQQAENFRARLAAASRLARKLDPISERMKSRANDYVSDITAMDAGVLTMLQMASDDEESAEAAQELFESVRGMVSATRESATAASELADVLDEGGGFSRELRGPMHQIRDAVRDVVDASSIVEGWEKRIDELQSGSGN